MIHKGRVQLCGPGYPDCPAPDRRLRVQLCVTSPPDCPAPSRRHEEEATQADPHCGSGPRYAHGLAAMRIVRARSFVRAGHGTSRSRRRSQRSERLNANSYQGKRLFPSPFTDIMRYVLTNLSPVSSFFAVDGKSMLYSLIYPTMSVPI
jgi:hypothetical protein